MSARSTEREIPREREQTESGEPATHWTPARPGGGMGSFEQSAPRPAPTAKPAKCARMSVFSPPVPVKASSAMPAMSGEAFRIHGVQSRRWRRQP